MLGLAALAVVPGAAVAVQELRTGESRAEEPEFESPSAAPSGPASASVKSSLPDGVVNGGGTVPFVEGKAMLGAYLDLDGRTQTQAVALRRKEMGRDLRILHNFYGWYDTLPTELEGIADDSHPMVSWRGTTYREITSGDSDALITAAAKRLKAQGRPVLLRWAWEMNGNWYDWSPVRNNNDPDGYTACWKRIRGIFDDVGADNVSWVWSPNTTSSSKDEWNSFAALYPGDDLVDWVGVSGYNLYRESPEKLFSPIYQEFATRKPIMITEIGAVDRGGSTKAEWTTLAAEWVEQHPAIGGMVWFDTDTHPGSDEKWAVDTDAKSLAAWVAIGKNARFSG